jgi:hypothetical protein
VIILKGDMVFNHTAWDLDWMIFTAQQNHMIREETNTNKIKLRGILILFKKRIQRAYHADLLSICGSDYSVSLFLCTVYGIPRYLENEIFSIYEYFKIEDGWI